MLQLPAPRLVGGFINIPASAPASYGPSMTPTGTAPTRPRSGVTGELATPNWPARNGVENGTLLDDRRLSRRRTGARNSGPRPKTLSAMASVACFASTSTSLSRVGSNRLSGAAGGDRGIMKRFGIRVQRTKGNEYVGRVGSS